MMQRTADRISSSAGRAMRRALLDHDRSDDQGDDRVGPGPTEHGVEQQTGQQDAGQVGSRIRPIVWSGCSTINRRPADANSRGPRSSLDQSNSKKIQLVCVAPAPASASTAVTTVPVARQRGSLVAAPVLLRGDRTC
jgi:hypothetical protein